MMLQKHLFTKPPAVRLKHPFFYLPTIFFNYYKSLFSAEHFEIGN